MHYAVYLDEFGHIGPFVSRRHERHNDSPVFGLAGMMLPVESVREFAIFFYQLKCHLLGWDLVHKNPVGLPAYQWEKKGSALFTVANVEKYRHLRAATNRLLNRIGNVKGKVFYTGEHKTAAPDAHDSAETFKRQLLQAIRKIHRHCQAENSTFVILLDEQQAGSKFRNQNVEACTLAMFEDKAEKSRTLVEPPMQGESHLFQTLQCADWLCGLVGRMAANAAAPGEYPDWEIFKRYFDVRLQSVCLAGSGLESQTAC